MNPMGWPSELVQVVEHSVTAELSTLTKAGGPITTPVTPYPGPAGDTIDVSTGVTYPAKAERARRNPRVALLFADPLGNPGAPVVLVQGLASVRDADLQANTDRYVALSAAKLPETVKGRPKLLLRRMGWYYARIWIQVTPLHVRWWHGSDLSEPARQWDAPADTAAVLSDPPPTGTQPPPWKAPVEWRGLAAHALDRLPLHDLTVVDSNGFPVCLPVAETRLVAEGIEVRIGTGAPELRPGPACFTAHGHPARFSGQENHSLVGRLEARDNGSLLLRVERALGDWSATGGPLRMGIGFLSKGRVLGPRLRREAARRNQPVPKVRFP